MTTILLSALGTAASVGTIHMLRNNPDNEPVRIIGTDLIPDVAQRHYVDQFYHAPTVEAMLEICRREKVDVVIPQVEEDTLKLAKAADQFQQCGATVLTSDVATVETAQDKGKLLQLVVKLGLPTAPFTLITSAEELLKAAVKLGYPEKELILKPTKMWGRRGLFHIKEDVGDHANFASVQSSLPFTLKEVADRLHRSKETIELVLMEYVRGTEYSVDLFLGSEVSLAIPRIRKTVLGGLATKTSLADHPEIRAMSLQIAKELELRYVAGFQYIVDDSNTPRILECNPRIQGTSIASLFSGANLIWLAVQEALGRPPQSLPRYTFDATFYRNWAGVARGANGSFSIG